MPGFNRRDMLKLGAGASAAASAFTGVSAKGRTAPNIILIINDGHPAHGVGACGGPLAALDPTPALDRLAAQATLFTNAHGGAAPASLPAANLLLAKDLQAAGYHTAMIGHWDSAAAPEAFEFYQVLGRSSAAFDPLWQVRGSLPFGQNTARTQGHQTDCLTDVTLDWLASRTDPRPFFLIQHGKPLDNLFDYAPRHASYLADEKVPEPLVLQQDRGLDRAYTQQAYQACLKAFLRCVKGIDENLARLLAYLEQAHLREQTLILYTARPIAMPLGEGFINPSWIHRASSNVPLIVAQPGGGEPLRRHDYIADSTRYAATLIATAARSAVQA